jgi:hypothetical protein
MHIQPHNPAAAAAATLTEDRDFRIAVAAKAELILEDRGLLINARARELLACYIEGSVSPEELIAMGDQLRLH